MVDSSQQQDLSLAFPPGSIIGGRYRIIGTIGFGGMGVVFKCAQVALGDRIVACKVLWPQLAKNPKLVERFRREVICCYDVSHPNVVRAYDFFEEGATVGFSMELIESGDLRRYLSKQGIVAPQVALSLFKEISQGLAAIHKAGIIHRDLKPENVLVTKEGVPKITDFGIAMLPYRQSMTPRGDVLGTFTYLAPEVLEGQESNKKTDLYALGMIGYELFLRETPFAGMTLIEQLAKKRKFDPAQIAANNAVPKEVSELICSLLRSDPNQRPASMDEVLSRVAAKQGSQLGTPPRRIAGLLRALIMLLVALLVAGALVYREFRQLLFQEAVTVPGHPTPEQTAMDSPTGLIVGAAVENRASSLSVSPTAAPTPEVVPKLTKLRILEGPTGRWQHSSLVELVRLNLKIRNVGSAEARDILVRVAIPGGKLVTMDGPLQLRANQVGDYVKEISEVVTSNEKLRADISCSNCRK